MKNAASAITWLNQHLWKVFFFVLPWQTRFFLESSPILSYPWEQGRISFYASWIILIVWAMSSIITRLIQWRKPTLVEILLVGSVLVSIGCSRSIRASFAWVLMTLFALLLVWLISRENISKQEIAKWFAFGLLPHALLAIAQVVFQQTWSTKWLGLPLLIPSESGVSVVLHQGARMLRGYGGFPHPNILGGYLAFSILLLLQVFEKLHHRFRWMALTALLTLGCIATSSRSAWLALGLGSFFLFRWSRRMIYIGIIASALFGFFLWPWTLRPLSTPSHAPEMQSVSERVIAARQVKHVIRVNPVIGVGPGSYIPTALKLGLQPLVPHSLFLLMLSEAGTLFTLFVSFLLIRFLRSHTSQLPLFFFLLPISILDHYLWSFWPGLALSAIFIAVIAKNENDT